MRSRFEFRKPYAMQLTRFTDYTLRTLMYLGMHPDVIVAASEISDAHGISVDHVAKTAKWLTRERYVKSRRGKHGGLSLARPARSIRIGALVRETEQLDVLECFNPAQNTCRLSSGCRLKGALFKARAAFLGVLDEYTLADLLANQSELIALLPRRANAIAERP
jgi:Rrf2 family nitric oxide-sensitive transcriptional repressor